MMRRITRHAMVALLVVGSAILLFSCDSAKPEPDRAREAAMMTEYSEDLSIVMSQNGQRSYYFETPLLEGYTLAAEPYREFRKGIKITTYQKDSLTSVDAVLTANYAIYYEKRELWEAKGDVVVKKYDGTEVYTQQLFWNARTKKIYSNVDTKLVKGNNVFVGERFESDEDFKDWRFYYQKSRMEVVVSPSEGADSTAVESAPAAKPTAEATADKRDEKPAVQQPNARKKPVQGDLQPMKLQSVEGNNRRSPSRALELEQPIPIQEQEERRAPNKLLK